MSDTRERAIEAMLRAHWDSAGQVPPPDGLADRYAAFIDALTAHVLAEMIADRYADGIELGADDMRERAAKECDARADDLTGTGWPEKTATANTLRGLGKRIRALPLSSEEEKPLAEQWAFRLGSYDVRASCPKHPAARVDRFGSLGRCSECSEAIDLCGATIGHKECVLAREHGGPHSSRSGSNWSRP